MKILGIEFSSLQRSVALIDGVTLSKENRGRFAEVIETGGRHAHPLAMTARVLTEAGLEREQIECLAIGIGPGSYTGIRAAISLAQGWQLAREIQLSVVSSADLIAEQARLDSVRGRVGVVIDAQRGEFYLGEYELVDQETRAVGQLRLASRGEVEIAGRDRELLVGPDIGRWFANGRDVYPRASTLAQIVLQTRVFVRGDQVEPIYLRPTAFVKAPGFGSA